MRERGREGLVMPTYVQKTSMDDEEGMCDTYETRRTINHVEIS